MFSINNWQSELFFHKNFVINCHNKDYITLVINIWSTLKCQSSINILLSNVS
jgi:hypothetical protein